MRINGFWNALGRLTAAFMLAILALTFFQVLLRYFFNSPVAWIEEISRYFFVWIVFLGSALAFRSGGHIKVDILEDSQERLRSALLILRVTITSAALLLLLWSGSLVAWRNRATPSYTIPDFPAVLFYGAVPLACVLMLAALCQWFWEARNPKDPRD